ncbi:unnamed protein product [Toxocara canis]|uniref:Ras-associating domain-containing protein n=1 Tax=Toxocara canis TaxID=6265 RepID=A0A183UMD2_TOXCA|nr:unnamed protein product [Toxocara canis]
MELKVNVDGVERSVSGLTETTTCAQIIYALAHATGQKGRFVLVEKYRNAVSFLLPYHQSAARITTADPMHLERSLAPTDRPLEMLRKWDQHSQHVRFVLKHLEGSTPTCAAGDPKSSDAEHLCTSAAAQSSNSAHKMALPTSVHFTSEHSCFPEVQAATSEMFAQGSASDRIATSCSTGCVRSVLSEGLHTFEAHPVWQQQYAHSSSYVASAPSSALRNRPPPPAYHEVIERRYNSLTRGASSSVTAQHNTLRSADHSCHHDSLPAHGSQPSASGATDISQELNLSAADLDRLVHNQQRIIEQQKARLAQLDIAVNDDDLREIIQVTSELVQLERQQANLRLVLNPLRALDWPARLQAEKMKVEQVGCAIVELQRKIDLLGSEVREKAILEKKIIEQIEAIQSEIFAIENGIVEEDDEHDPQPELLAS